MKAAKNEGLRVLVCGAYGRTGKRVIQKINEDSRFQLSGAIDKTRSPEGGVFRCAAPSFFESLVKTSDVTVEFTVPDAALKFAKASAKAGKPIVIGTTGFSRSQLKQIRKTAEQIPVFMSPNMSPAANLMFAVVRYMAAKLYKFDISINEITHSRQSDIPTGTALELMKSAASGRSGNFIPEISSMRSGDTVGEQTVIYAGPFERLEIRHITQSFELFAYGALEAAYWITRRHKPGIYSFMDLMGISEIIEKK